MRPGIHNRFKLPVRSASSRFRPGLAIYGVVTARWLGLVVGLIGIAIAYFGAIVCVVLFSDRNPWWMRSPLDPGQRPDRRAGG